MTLTTIRAKLTGEDAAAVNRAFDKLDDALCDPRNWMLYRSTGTEPSRPAKKSARKASKARRAVNRRARDEGSE